MLYCSNHLIRVFGLLLQSRWDSVQTGIQYIYLPESRSRGLMSITDLFLSIIIALSTNIALFDLIWQRVFSRVERTVWLTFFIFLLLFWVLHFVIKTLNKFHWDIFSYWQLVFFKVYKLYFADLRFKLKFLLLTIFKYHPFIQFSPKTSKF